MNKGFNREERSTFKYWFAHWCAYNMTALVYHCWKFKYLFHDIEKPWLRLVMSYERVQRLHRMHNRHHPQCRCGVYKLDYEAMLIDWECSRFTKIASPRTAIEMIPNEVRMFSESHTPEEVSYFERMLRETATKIGLK